MKALATWGCHLNIGMSTICVWYLALSNNKTNLSGQKKKTEFLLKSPIFPGVLQKKIFFNITTAELLLLQWIWYIGQQQSIEKAHTFEWYV